MYDHRTISCKNQLSFISSIFLSKAGSKLFIKALWSFSGLWPLEFWTPLVVEIQQLPWKAFFNICLPSWWRGFLLIVSQNFPTSSLCQFTLILLLCTRIVRLIFSLPSHSAVKLIPHLLSSFGAKQGPFSQYLHTSCFLDP